MARSVTISMAEAASHQYRKTLAYLTLVPRGIHAIGAAVIQLWCRLVPVAQTVARPNSELVRQPRGTMACKKCW